MTKLDISSSKTLFLLLINHITTMRENDCIPTDFGSLFKPNRVRIPIKVNNQISNPQGPDPHTINMTGIRYPKLLSLFFSYSKRLRSISRAWSVSLEVSPHQRTPGLRVRTQRKIQIWIRIRNPGHPGCESRLRLTGFDPRENADPT